MGSIYLYTGNGAGKTTAALGLALRSVGHEHKVVIVQFMKGRKDIGEYKIQEKLAPYYEIHQFGREGFVDLKNPAKEDIEIAQKGLEFAKESLKKEPDVLILDEINIAVAINLLKVSDVLELINNIPEKTVVVLTGRHAPKEFIERSDFINEINDIKHPYQKNIKSQKGIQY